MSSAATASSCCWVMAWKSTTFAGEVLAQQAVGVLVRAALPGALGVAEEHLHAGVDGELGMAGHLQPLIPCQRSAQLLGQRLDLAGQRRADGDRVMVGELDQQHDLLERSTSVPIGDMALPNSRSPSQWPGTSRSSASAGRSEMWTAPTILPPPLSFNPRCPRGRRTVRPDRRCWVNSRRSAPRDCTNSDR